jgi:hypothetical protein
MAVDIAVAYGMSDMAPTTDGRIGPGTVSVPPDRGGCGDQHTVETDHTGHPYITCGVCAPVLIGGMYGWANTPAGVPLTPDEQSEVETAEREGQQMQRVAMRTMGAHLADMVKAQHQPTEQPVLSASSLAAQLAVLSAEDKAEIVKALSGAVPVPEPTGDVSVAGPTASASGGSKASPPARKPPAPPQRRTRTP